MEVLCAFLPRDVASLCAGYAARFDVQGALVSRLGEHDLFICAQISLPLRLLVRRGGALLSLLAIPGRAAVLDERGAVLHEVEHFDFGSLEHHVKVLRGDVTHHAMYSSLDLEAGLGITHQGCVQSHQAQGSFQVQICTVNGPWHLRSLDGDRLVGTYHLDVVVFEDRGRGDARMLAGHTLSPITNLLTLHDNVVVACADGQLAVWRQASQAPRCRSEAHAPDDCPSTHFLHLPSPHDRSLCLLVRLVSDRWLSVDARRVCLWHGWQLVHCFSAEKRVFAHPVTAVETPDGQVLLLRMEAGGRYATLLLDPCTGGTTRLECAASYLTRLEDGRVLMVDEHRYVTLHGTRDLLA